MAHRAGVASDALTGRTEGRPGPAWTAVQVADREGVALEDVMAEWEKLAPRICEGLADRSIQPTIVQDVLTHEADLREAFGSDPLPAEVVDTALRLLVRFVVTNAAPDGDLRIRTSDREWCADEGVAAVTVTVEPYELYRGLMSRRDRSRMRAWDWSGDAERYVDALPVFGPVDAPTG